MPSAYFHIILTRDRSLQSPLNLYTAPQMGTTSSINYWDLWTSRILPPTPLRQQLDPDSTQGMCCALEIVGPFSQQTVRPFGDSHARLPITTEWRQQDGGLRPSTHCVNKFSWADVLQIWIDFRLTKLWKWCMNGTWNSEKYIFLPLRVIELHIGLNYIYPLWEILDSFRLSKIMREWNTTL